MRPTPFALVVALLITPGLAADAPPEKPPADFAPYTESIPKFFIKIDFLPIKGGRVTLAPATPNDPPREYVVKDFWMAKCEITWDAFDVYRASQDLNAQERMKDDAIPMHLSFLRSRPSKPYMNPDGNFGHSGYAANSIYFPSAVAYAEFLSKHTGRKYRLPTEAEFEYAARAGRLALPADALDAEAWHRGNAPVEEHPDGTPHPAGSRAANPWGLHDMLGNLAEWTLPLDPKSPPAARGGSYRTPAAKLHFGYRQPFNPRWNAIDPMSPWWLSDGEFIGFRLVRERTESK